MKKQLLSLFAIMALGTNVLMAQNWTVPTTVPINNDFNINLPTRQGGQGAVKNGDSRVACANDTVMYALQKNIGTTVTGFNYNNTGLAGGGQYFMAPQQITVHGFTFYANAASAVNVTAKIFLAGADSLPTGTALATTSVAVT
ncbi:MAG: hypothetical protein M3Q58_06865, partial [Bacteroidota bacterium]|nr:hypothetical protein [Bacteroidota bacterium]